MNLAVELQYLASSAHGLLDLRDQSIRPKDCRTKAEMAKENGVFQNGTSSKNHLHVIDQRTGKHYELPISHNAVNASDFQQIKAAENHEYYADQDEQGVRIFDPGFSNTAVSTSNITYV